jgi:hypothetical protein
VLGVMLVLAPRRSARLFHQRRRRQRRRSVIARALGSGDAIFGGWCSTPATTRRSASAG